MKFKSMTRPWILALGLFGCAAWAGSFEGVVQTDTLVPVENVLVILTDDQGNTEQTVTLPDGSYVFDNLSAGWYTVHILVPPGYLLYAPPCGFHYKYVKTKGRTRGNFGLKAGSSGVVIEFGKPGGRSSRGLKSLNQNNGYFLVSVYLANMVGLTPPYPQTITVRGTWIIPGYGPVFVSGVSGSGAGAYASSLINVGFRNLVSNRMEITMSRASWPHFSLDGEAVMLEFYLPDYLALLEHSNGQIIFCIESITLQNGDVISVAFFWPYIAYFQ